VARQKLLQYLQGPPRWHRGLVLSAATGISKAFIYIHSKTSRLRGLSIAGRAKRGIAAAVSNLEGWYACCCLIVRSRWNLEGSR
jgi:hypothetical protein